MKNVKEYCEKINNFGEAELSEVSILEKEEVNLEEDFDFEEDFER